MKPHPIKTSLKHQHVKTPAFIYSQLMTASLIVLIAWLLHITLEAFTALSHAGLL